VAGGWAVGSRRQIDSTSPSRESLPFSSGRVRIVIILKHQIDLSKSSINGEILNKLIGQD